MGLTLPKYYSWLMDTETLEIIYKWRTPQNDSFMCKLNENKFLYGSETRIGYDEFYVNEGKFIRKNIYNNEYKENITEYDWGEDFGIKHFLNENTFVSFNLKGILMIFKCKKY